MNIFLFISVESLKLGLQVNSINRATVFENIGPSVDLRRRRKQKNCFSWARQKKSTFHIFVEKLQRLSSGEVKAEVVDNRHTRPKIMACNKK